MANKKRRILLLLDNASSHILKGQTKERYSAFHMQKLSNVTFLFLPPNCTSIIQPLDQGIIHSFKAHYRKTFLNWCVVDLDNVNSMRGHANVKQALLWTVNAWEDVTLQTVKMCWKKCKILPITMQHDLIVDDERKHLAVESMIEYELNELISALNLGDVAMETREFLNMHGEDEIEEPWSDEELLLIARGNKVSTEVDSEPFQQSGFLLPDLNENPDDICPPVVSLEEAKKFLHGALTFLGSNDHIFDEKDILVVERLCFKVNKAVIVNRHLHRQSSITSFFEAK